MIHHFSGVIIHPNARIGKNCTLRQGVTIGVKHDDGRPPRIGDNFVAGAYAQILGDISIEDNVQVGALSLMTIHGEPNSTYVGIPARKL
jgi:serine O-acetyltransferase